MTSLVTQGDLSSRFTFYIESEVKSVVHVSLDPDLPVVRVDVDLGGLPNDQGYEVVV